MAFLKYSLIRLALFVPLFALFVFLQLGWLLAVICAGLIAFAVSYLFFQKQRDAATAALHARFSGKAKPLRTAGEVADADAEDRLTDANPDVTIRNEIRNDIRNSEAPHREIPYSDRNGNPGTRKRRTRFPLRPLCRGRPAVRAYWPWLSTSPSENSRRSRG